MWVGETYRARIKITAEGASFELNDELYYKCLLKPGEIEKVGSVGFTSFSGIGSSKIENFIVEPLLELK